MTPRPPSSTRTRYQPTSPRCRTRTGNAPPCAMQHQHCHHRYPDYQHVRTRLHTTHTPHLCSYAPRTTPSCPDSTQLPTDQPSPGTHLPVAFSPTPRQHRPSPQTSTNPLQSSPTVRPSRSTRTMFSTPTRPQPHQGPLHQRPRRSPQTPAPQPRPHDHARRRCQGSTPATVTPTRHRHHATPADPSPIRHLSP